MIALTVGHTRLRIDPLTLVLPPLADALGMGAEVAALGMSLVVHETAHLLAARVLGVRVDCLRLMPFGAAAELGNLYALSAWQLFLVALTGPLANLGLMIFCAALAQWGVLSPLAALCALRVNLTLMLFNLLPALPLDGGRMLYAALSIRTGRTRAAEIGIWSGRVVAAMLAIGAVIEWTRHGRLNLSMLFAALFIIASAGSERRALSDARAETLLKSLRHSLDPMPLRLLAVDAQCPARRALRATGGDPALFAAYDGTRLMGFVDDRQLLETALASPAAKVIGALQPKRRAG